MVVVGLLAGAAAASLWVYKAMTRLPDHGVELLTSVKTQAAVVAAFAGAVFTVIEALTKAKVSVTSVAGPMTLTGSPTSFGAPGAALRPAVT